MHRHHRRKARRGHRGGWRMGGRFFRAGEVRIALLGLLKDSPKHGYELMRELEERSGGAYQASAGTVYPTLQQLEDEGLARSESQDGRRVYRLTPEGERAVDEAADELQHIWRRAEEWGDWGFVGDPDAAEVVRPAMRLAREVYRVAQRSYGDPEVIDRVRDILQRAREDIRDLSQRRRR